MVDAKKTDTSSFEDVLFRIKNDAEMLKEATDTLRFSFNMLCTVFSESYKSESEAKKAVETLGAEGWQEIIIISNVVSAEGLLYSYLKKAGIEYCSKTPAWTNSVDGTSLSISNYLGFGKINNKWTFYLMRKVGDHVASTPFNEIRRDEITQVMDVLPKFLEDYARTLKERTERAVIDSQKAKNIRDALKSSLGNRGG